LNNIIYSLFQTQNTNAFYNVLIGTLVCTGFVIYDMFARRYSKI